MQISELKNRLRNTPLRGIGLFVLLGGLTFLLGGALFNYVVMPQIVGHGTTVIVPDLKGLTLNQAVSLCERRDLLVEESRREYSDLYPEGMVVSQQPYPLTNVKTGRWVKVVVSRGPITEVVPELRGVSARQAELLLERNHLTLGRVAKIYRPFGAKGVVLSSRPGSGRARAQGDSVRVLISYGGMPRRFLMPDLRGKDYVFVRQKLEALGFQIGRLVFERDKTKYPNTILSHTPPPGSVIQEGESIVLVASTTD